MKKFLFVVGLVAALAVLTTSRASANGGPHGGYTASTDACAGCHRAHTASGAKLLIANDTLTLCMTCHGSAGTGADTNVADGFFLSTRSISTEGTANTIDNAPLLGGGFTNYRLAATTSSHSVNATTAAAWGNGVARGVTGAMADGNMTCASCHDPHGSSNYRILRTQINGTAVSVAQVDEATKDYDTEQWGTGQSSVCAACHGAYHRTGTGQGSTLDGGSYTHRVDMSYAYTSPATGLPNANPETTGMGGFTLPLSETGTNNRVVCQTCHLPHGSSVAMTGIANGGPGGTGTLPGNTTAADSALLRLSNRAVCEVCHQR